MTRHFYYEHDSTFGQAMLKLRTSIGLTQAGLADPSGRWVATITAACSADRSAAKASWKCAGLIAYSTVVWAPWLIG